MHCTEWLKKSTYSVHDRRRRAGDVLGETIRLAEIVLVDEGQGVVDDEQQQAIVGRITGE